MFPNVSMFLKISTFSEDLMSAHMEKEIFDRELAILSYLFVPPAGKCWIHGCSVSLSP